MLVGLNRHDSQGVRKVSDLHWTGSQYSWSKWSSSSPFRRIQGTGQFRACQFGKRARYRFWARLFQLGPESFPAASRSVACWSCFLEIFRRVCLSRHAMLMLERLKTSKQDDVRSEPREVGPSPQPPLLLFLQGEIGQVPQKPLQRHNLRPSLSGGYLCLSPTIGARNTLVGCRSRRSFARPYAITFSRS
jgi:hypothetical protein